MPQIDLEPPRSSIDIYDNRLRQKPTIANESEPTGKHRQPDVATNNNKKFPTNLQLALQNVYAFSAMSSSTVYLF